MIRASWGNSAQPDEHRRRPPLSRRRLNFGPTRPNAAGDDLSPRVTVHRARSAEGGFRARRARRSCRDPTPGRAPARSTAPPSPRSSSVGELVLPEVMVGMTPASTTRSPATPRTARRLSTTAIGSSARPIRVVPAGWKIVVAMSPASLTSSSSVWNCTPGFHSSGSYLRHGRLRDDVPGDAQRRRPPPRGLPGCSGSSARWPARPGSAGS